MNIKDSWLYFLIHLENMGKSRHTIKQYKIDGKQFMEFLYNKLEIPYTEEFLLKEETLKQVSLDYIQYLCAEFKPNSINRKISSLKSFIRFAVFREWIPSDFSDDLQPLPKPRDELEFITLSEIEKLIRHYEGLLENTHDKKNSWLNLRDYGILLFLTEYGLKPHELITLTWGHIHDNILFINLERQYLLSSKIMKWIIKYREESEGLFTIGHHSPLWLGLGNKRGEGITEKTIERICTNYSTIIGRKITSTNFRYQTVFAANERMETPSLIADYLGYAQSSVYWERFNRLNKH